MNEKLQELINWIPVFQSMTGIDAAITIWDTQGVVQAFYPAKSFGLHFEVGFEFPDKNDKLYEVMKTGKALYSKLPKEAVGVAIEASITPIYDGREIVGAVTFAVSADDREEIINSADGLSHSVVQTEQYIEELTIGTKDLAVNMSQVQEITELVRKQVEEANQIVSEIQRNANYSNILALNASIESARAGQAGKGFAVVSDEMGKFAKMSGEAATRINKNLAEIVKSLNEVTMSIDQSAGIAVKQEKSVDELNSMFKEVTVTAKKVTETCKKMSYI